MRIKRSSIEFISLLALVITLIFSFAPFRLIMPTVVDGEKFATNYAIAHHYEFGNQFIYTYGPLGELYSGQYYPNLDLIGIIFGILIGIAVFVLVLPKYRSSTRLIQFGFIISLSGMAYYRDSLFYLALFLVLEVILKPSKNLYQILATSFIISIVPLVKGSFIPLALILFLSSIFLEFLYKNLRNIMYILISTAIILTTTWSITGQKIDNLFQFFVSEFSVIQGYTDAMSINGTRKITYLFVFLAILNIFLYRSKEIKKPQKYIGIFLMCCTFELIFKAAYIRADSHIVLASSALLLIASVEIMDKLPRGTKLLIASITITFWIIVDSLILGSTFKNIPENSFNFYKQSIFGISDRLHGNQSNHNYLTSLRKIAEGNPLPSLVGTTDIYSYNQAALLANNLIYSPRPAVQSYAAYTPFLADKDANYLNSLMAPKNILFRLQPIDFRLPSTEDGPSWIYLKRNYQYTPSTSSYTVLQQRPHFLGLNESVENINTRTNVWTKVKPGGEIYAKIDIGKTPLGNLVNLLYKCPQIRIEMIDSANQIHTYRVNASMIKSKFLISPLVRSDKEFIKFITSQSDIRIHQFRIVIPEQYGILWKPNFKLKLYYEK